MGAVSACINPNWIALQRSQGYQSDSHKLFMRLSVLSTDILVYFTAVIAYVNYIMQHLRSQKVCMTLYWITMCTLFVLDFLGCTEDCYNFCDLVSTCYYPH